MNYTLAKRLEKAGFPQTSPLLKKYYPSIAKALSVVHKKANGKIDPRYPTLEELIEECGDIAFELNKADKGKNWTACDDTMTKGEGKTPLEAVANLYLKLKE